MSSLVSFKSTRITMFDGKAKLSAAKNKSVREILNKLNFHLVFNINRSSIKHCLSNTI